MFIRNTLALALAIAGLFSVSAANAGGSSYQDHACGCHKPTNPASQEDVQAANAANAAAQAAANATGGNATGGDAKSNANVEAVLKSISDAKANATGGNANAKTGEQVASQYASLSSADQTTVLNAPSVKTDTNVLTALKEISTGASTASSGSSAVNKLNNAFSNATTTNVTTGGMNVGGTVYQAVRPPVAGAVVGLPIGFGPTSPQMTSFTTTCGDELEVKKVSPGNLVTTSLMGLWTTVRDSGGGEYTLVVKPDGKKMQMTPWVKIGEETDVNGNVWDVLEAQKEGRQYTVMNYVIGSGAVGGLTINGANGAGSASGGSNAQGYGNRPFEYTCSVPYTMRALQKKVAPPTTVVPPTTTSSVERVETRPVRTEITVPARPAQNVRLPARPVRQVTVVTGMETRTCTSVNGGQSMCGNWSRVGK